MANLNRLLTEKRTLLDYTNHRGERRERTVIIQTFYFGTSDFHPGEPQWFLHAFDVKKQALRHFAVKDIHNITAVQ